MGSFTLSKPATADRGRGSDRGWLDRVTMTRPLTRNYAAWIPVFALLALTSATSLAHAVPIPTVTVRFDASQPTSAAGDAPITPPVSARFAHWARLDADTPAAATAEPEGAAVVRGTGDHTGHAGLSVANPSAGEVEVRVVARLPQGLWRADAALVDAASSAAPRASRLWRMESVLLSGTGTTRKGVLLEPGQSLFIRWTETSAAASDARKAVRRALWTTDNGALQDRVSGALTPVDEILDAMPLLIERGDRARMTRRVHTALLATAKAQALWENGRGIALTDRDAPFAALLTALSEISCAAFNLVPAQTVLSVPGAESSVRITLTNAGGRSVGLVALGIERLVGGSNSDLTVYRSLAPGATVTTRFPTSDPALVRGIVQFISDMGAATIPASPAPPTVECAGAASEAADP